MDDTWNFADNMKITMRCKRIIKYFSVSLPLCFSVTLDWEDIFLKLVDSRTFHNAEKKRDMSDIHTCYEGEIDGISGVADNAFAGYRDSMLSGFHEKVCFFGSNVSDFSQEKHECQMKQCIKKEQKLKKGAAGLKNTTTIFIDCMVDLLGTSYAALGREIAGQIASEEYSFVNNRSDADYVITLRGAAHRYNEDTPGQKTVYFSSVDVQVNIDKTISAKIICEEEVSCRSGHTISYEEAAKLAYKDLVPKIVSIINNCIKD